MIPAKSLRCETCGAPVAWDADAGALSCGYCGGTKAVERAEAAIVEHDLTEAALTRNRGWGVKTRRIVCSGCGAAVSFDPGVIASRCPFCASHQIAERDHDAPTPESLLPFTVAQGEAERRFASWLKSLWFRPSDLKRMAKLKEIRGVYLPWFTFDAEAHSWWRAEAGYHYWETETYTTTENGRSVTRTRQVQRTRWVPASGHREDRHDDELVYASVGLPRPLVDEVRPFDTRELVPYRPDYLAGWGAEEAGFGVDQGWQIGRQQLDEEQRRRCAGDVPGDTHRNLQVENEYGQVTFKHVLLPVFVSAYAYRDKVYRFLVNGQTGEVTGEAPWSWVKITLAALAALAALLILLSLEHR